MTYQVTVTEQVTDITTTDDVTSITITETPAIISEQVAGIQGVKGDTGQQGLKGDKGDTGPAGPGVATGGTTGQVLAKTSATDYATNWITPNAGTVTSITATSPLTGGTITSNGSIGLDQTALSLDGARITSGTINSARIPTLNQNTTGTASNITGTLGISQGGTGLIYGNSFVGGAVRTSNRNLTNNGLSDYIFTNSAGSAVYLNVKANTLYQFEFQLEFSKKASTVAGNSIVQVFSIASGSSSAVTPQSLQLNGLITGTTTSAGTIGYFTGTSANTDLFSTASNTTTGITQNIRCWGYILTNLTTAGRIGFGVNQSSAATTGSATVNTGSWCVVREIASGSNLTYGNWS